MTNFKEYLLLNEEKDPQIFAIKKICKNDFDIILKAGGTGPGSEKNIMKKINTEIKDSDKQFENFEDIKKLTKKIISKEKTKNANKKDIEESDTKIEDFYRIIYNKRNIIEQISPHNVSKVREILQKVDINSDKTIDKKEFQNAIKEIKKSIDKNYAAMITYLMYILSVGGSHFAVGQTTGTLTNDSNIKPEKIFTDENDKEIKDYFTDNEKIEHLNSLFKELKGFTFEKSILKNFKTYEAAKCVFNDKTELNGFTSKTQDPEDENSEDENSEDESSEDEDLSDKVISKKKWYIFDTVPPETEEDDIEGFFSSIKGECKKILNDIVEKMDEYTPKDRSKNLKEPVEENIVNKYLKSTITEERLETYKKYFDGLKEDLEEEKNNLEREIEEILADLSGKVKDLAEILKNETNYKNKVKNQVKFRQLFIECGYTITKKIQKFTKDAAEVLKKVKVLKHFDNQKDEITPEQQKTNELDIKRISDMLLKANEIDHYNIARFMLINLLHTNNNSEQVLDKLKEKDFKNMKGFVYVGNSNKVFAFDKRKIKKNIIGDYTFYDFEQTSAESYKNPSSLMLAAFGIDVNTLTTEVLKGLRERTTSLKKQAEDYLAKANELVRIFSNISKTASSVVTEGLFGLGSKEDTEVKNYLSDVKKIDDTKDTNKEIENLLNIAAREIKLPDGYEPTDNGADDLALRQFLKGYSLIVSKNGKKYVTTIENSKKIKEMIKNKNAEIKSKNAEDGTQINDQATQNAVKFNSDATSGQVYDSVVTSSAADSTYGDGYGYNKKADAIKKKLNCTTYTYSPNPKMKIVRRTFD